MKREANRLMDQAIQAMIAAGKPGAKSDGRGLTLTISANGCASWILRTLENGKRGELTLGRYPDLSIAAARETVAILKRHDARVKAANRIGRNPIF